MAMSEDCGKIGSMSMIPSSLSNGDVFSMAGGKRKFSEAEPQTNKLASYLTENLSKRLESDHIAFQDASDVADSVKKRVVKAERKKHHNLSDESANLKSPNNAKLGLATQVAAEAAQINQKSENSQKQPHAEIETTELYQSLMSFREADHQTLSLGSPPHGLLEPNQDCDRNLSH